MSKKTSKGRYTRTLGLPFTVERKRDFIQTFRFDPDLGGRKHMCAESIGVCAGTVDHHRRMDPEFGEAYDEALQGWIDENLFTPALVRARDGVERPIMGGKFRDEVVATVREFSDSLALAMLRAHRGEFKDNSKISPMGKSGNAGVLVVPAAPLHPGEWEDLYGDMAKGLGPDTETEGNA